MKHLSYSQRAEYATNPTGKRLLALMDEKQTNLALSIDLTRSKEILDMVDQVGSEIALLKTHIDIISDFNSDLVAKLQGLAQKHHFLIFEDRKFADIGNTVLHQYQGGMYRISDWADIVNAHGVGGPGVIESIRQVGLVKGRGLLLLAEMSSAGTLAKGAYTKKIIRMGEDNQDIVIGFISLKKLSDEPGLIYMTPGVHLASRGDALGQQYLSPEKVILEHESDVIIVGRGIFKAEDPHREAKKYRDAGWEAYLKRIE